MRDGDALRVRQGAGEALVDAAIDDRLPAGCLRLAAARPETAALGALYGTVTAERVPARQKVAV
jgi:NADH-quinone oxidoreductase subunit G